MPALQFLTALLSNLPAALPGMEYRKTGYLTEHKGREKIGAATSAIKVYNAGQRKRLNGVMANLDAPDADFNRRIEETRKKLGNARPK